MKLTLNKLGVLVLFLVLIGGGWALSSAHQAKAQAAPVSLGGPILDNFCNGQEVCDATTGEGIYCQGNSVCTIDYGSTVEVDWNESEAYVNCIVQSSNGDSWSGTSGSLIDGPLYQTTYYFLYCYNGVQSVDGYVPTPIGQVEVDVNPDNTNITCNGQDTSCNITNGSSATIAWQTSSHYAGCYVSQGFALGETPEGAPVGGEGQTWPGASGSQSTGPLTQTTTYALNCQVVGSDTISVPMAVDSVTVNVGPATSLTCNGSASSCSIPYNTSATIAWTAASNLTGCSVGTNFISGGSWNGSSGSESTGPLTQNTTYYLVCSAVANDTISRPGPVASVTVNMSTQSSITCNGSTQGCTIPYGTSATIAWSGAVGGYGSCTVTPGGWTGASGSHPTGNLTTTTTYTLNCGGRVSPTGFSFDLPDQQVTVTVTGPSGDFTLDCTPVTATVALGDSVSFNLNTTRHNGFNGSISFSEPQFSAADSKFTPPTNEYQGNPTGVIISNYERPVTSILSTDSNTTPEVPYTVTYTATGGNTTQTCEVYLYVESSPPLYPVNVNVSNANCGAIDVTWNDNYKVNVGAGGPAGYRVYRRTSGTGTASDSWTQVGNDIPATWQSPGDVNPGGGLDGGGVDLIRGGLDYINNINPVHIKEAKALNQYDPPNSSSSSSYTFRDSSPLSPNGSNYYAVASYDSLNLESDKIEPSTTPIVPQSCSSNLTSSDLDMVSVQGHITKSFNAQACSGASETATLPNNTLFSPGDVVTLQLNICNTGLSPMTGISAHVSLSNLVNPQVISSGPKGCVLTQNVGASTLDFTFADISNFVPGRGSVTNCSVTYSATVKTPTNNVSALGRFQSIADITTAAGNGRVFTPPYLFGLTGGVPNRNETAPN